MSPHDVEALAEPYVNIRARGSPTPAARPRSVTEFIDKLPEERDLAEVIDLRKRDEAR